MSFSLTCGDVMPGCSVRFEADTKDALLGEVAEHAKQDHGIEEVTPEVLGAVEAAIREN